MNRASSLWCLVIGGIFSLVGCQPQPPPETESAERREIAQAPSGFTTEFDEHGATLRIPMTASQPLGLRLRRYGCPSTLRTVATVAPRVQTTGTAYLRPGLREWYVNRHSGLEQGFTLDSPPCSDAQKLIFEVGITGATARQHGNDVELRDTSGLVVYRYSDLSAFDADGQRLPGRMVARGDFVQLIIDDSGARYPVTIDPLVWIHMQKLVASDGASKDAFGDHLALSADVAVVGVPNATVTGKANAGAAYVYALGTTWAEQAKLVATDPGVSAGFGTAVAVSSDTVVVGSPTAEVMGTSYVGAAYVFTRSGTTWTQQAKLTASDGAAYCAFGKAVAISGDTLIVGAPQKDDMGSSYVGAVYVFTRSGSTWSEKAKLLASDRHQYDTFGSTLSLDGERLAIAAPGVDLGGYARVGAVYIFDRITGTFTQQAKILAPMSVWTIRRWFGTSVSLSGDSVAIGTDYSYAFVFAKSGSMWNEQATLSATLEPGGQTVALDGDTALSGYPGSSWYGTVDIYSRSGTTWTKGSQSLYAFDGLRDDLFGHAVAMRGDWAIAGLPNAKIGSATEVGAVYAFKLGMPKGNGNACAFDSECTSGHCSDRVCCDTACGYGLPTDCQACSVASGAASDGTCGKVKAGVVCRPAADLCDAADSCDGSALTCPTDKTLPSGTVCRTVAGVCDKEETCSGTGKTCPSDSFKPFTTECRAANGDCDAAEYCDGTGAACPIDKFKPLLTSCRTAVGPCDTVEYCSGFSRDCPVDKFAASGMSCRTAAGPCDVPESCNGTSAACPTDQFQPSSVVCRPSAKDCDAPDSCTGSSAVCPGDQQSADGASCATGRCEKGVCRPEADLRVTLEADRQTVKAQQPIQFTATVFNAGRAEAQTVALVLANPPTAALAQLGGPGWGCQSAAGGAVCTVDKLGASRNATLTMTLVPPLEQTVFNVSAQAKSALPDPVPENNFVTLLVKNDQPGPGEEPEIPTIPNPNGCSCTLAARPSSPPPLLFALALIAALALVRRRTAR